MWTLKNPDLLEDKDTDADPRPFVFDTKPSRLRTDLATESFGLVLVKRAFVCCACP